MTRLTELVLACVVAAEAAGWLVIVSALHYFSIGFTASGGGLGLIAALATVGAASGFVVWLLTHGPKRGAA